MATILEDYIAKHPGSAQRYLEASTIFPGGVTHDTRYAQPFPLYMTHGEGPRKWDVDGNEYVDYVSGHGALLLGHSHPAIAEAVSKQIQLGTHLGASTDDEIRWAKAIMALMPSIEKLRFHSSGTEATLMAMRLARAYTGKDKVIKLQDHFHGWHDYAMAGSDRSAPGIPEVTWGTMVIVPPGDLPAVEDVIKRDPDIAAIILEPTGAHFGQLPFDAPNYLTGLRALTAQAGVILIFDEVDSGVGGAVAAAVGERLSRLGEGRQVLVITHSPQVAARAGHHWRILKQMKGGNARTTVEDLDLDPDRRREEIARMLAGAKITDEARAAADSLLQAAST
jgi:glutamate-1-semialdehyde 2,1-aminomutase